MKMTLFLLAQGNDDTAGALAGLIVGVLYLAVIILSIAGIWKTFVKAGKPGWASIVPIYNGVVLAEAAGKPGWWGILLLLPCVNIVILLILCLELAKCFGKGAGMGLGLFFFPFICYPILGFGSAKYQGAPAAA